MAEGEGFGLYARAENTELAHFSRRTIRNNLPICPQLERIRNTAFSANNALLTRTPSDRPDRIT